MLGSESAGPDGAWFSGDSASAVQGVSRFRSGDLLAEPVIPDHSLAPADGQSSCWSWLDEVPSQRNPPSRPNK